MKPGQQIHESVFVNIEQTKVHPKAHLYGSFEWSDTENVKLKMMENDLFTNTSALMCKIHGSKEVSEEDSNALLAWLTALGELSLTYSQYAVLTANCRLSR